MIGWILFFIGLGKTMGLFMHGKIFIRHYSTFISQKSNMGKSTVIDCKKFCRKNCIGKCIEKSRWKNSTVQFFRNASKKKYRHFSGFSKKKKKNWNIRELQFMFLMFWSLLCFFPHPFFIFHPGKCTRIFPIWNWWAKKRQSDEMVVWGHPKNASACVVFPFSFHTFGKNFLKFTHTEERLLTLFDDFQQNAIFNLFGRCGKFRLEYSNIFMGFLMDFFHIWRFTSYRGFSGQKYQSARHKICPHLILSGILQAKKKQYWKKNL